MRVKWFMVSMVVGMLVCGAVGCKQATPSPALPDESVSSVHKQESDLNPSVVASEAGEMITRSTEVDGFDRLSIKGQAQVILTQENRESLVIEADSDSLSSIEVDVTGRTLEIIIPADLDPVDTITIWISMLDLTSIELSGTVSLEMDQFEIDRLSLELRGASHLIADKLKVDSIDITISGASEVTLAGDAVTQNIKLSGEGSYDGRDLNSDTATVIASGAGTAVLSVKNTLHVENSGAGDVIYYGSPTVTKNNSGSGRLIRRDNQSEQNLHQEHQNLTKSNICAIIERTF